MFVWNFQVNCNIYIYIYIYIYILATIHLEIPYKEDTSNHKNHINHMNSVKLKTYALSKLLSYLLKLYEDHFSVLKIEDVP